VKTSRLLVRLLPALLAFLLASAQPAGRHLPSYGEEAIASLDRDSRPGRSADLITRKQRYAASIEEYFAIDDDADQYIESPRRLAAALARSTPITAAPLPLPCYGEVPPSHRPCAAPPTGPPHA
jgi:hypothetical protein